MGKEETIKYWIIASERDKKSALDMLRDGNYNWSLFLWQLVLERLLKALIVKKDKEVIRTHNLVRLSEIADIELSDDQRAELTEISRFNIEARYDDYKDEFYRKATKEYTKKWSEIAQRIEKWIIQKI
ncbi:DNA-binding protein [Candidatus Berkelbacteria bacterium CG_4_8_14_3_um_filter_33_6]|uniref:DNA-binding protein n=1 Tax=Candidatus Berkelbacteria bacterium CG_4_10_14_0_2_um_filter_35_9_33_12 TaxID=1974499 RepID=A0A2M7W3R8_9BACT|nr:MAG: DNA-binding protein [Candidatus Berkelbacteria bacterium CG23_combo_of_CG06-09_8_20_14_all_33_15]PIX31225.1 MAG: DNA-binding protein [Candidatus Berkelbacteria bacterium CG_4_8_14_3_um_filter_33_6]PIZ27940.1 MAG: DNA-binding protein [Candidatus Berkelbacteria bacterium CG_4_10_14_0_8_um_filter_35_9_33_8]PJA20019.1 MAG: DNA-binding protein [Candidatus Berkelbacteria bacterium CG_4_10_14_0_2_um_filter_35_9_33_12]